MNYLHETVLRSIIDLLTDPSSVGRLVDKVDTGSVKSIASKSANLIAVFPVIAPTSLNIKTDTIIAKAIERNCTALLQLLLSANSITYANNAEDFLRRFHTNLSLDKSSDLKKDLVSTYNLLSNESAVQLFDEVSKMARNTINKTVNKNHLDMINKDMKNINSYTMNPDYNPRSLKEFYVESVNGKLGVGIKLLNEKADPEGAYQYNANARVVPTDVAKANEIVPTLLSVTIYSKDNQGDVIEVNVMIGVKAKLYVDDAASIYNRMLVNSPKNSLLQNFFKATTRETSFVKDFMFALEKIKLDAVTANKNSIPWRVLERRASKNSSKLRNIISGGSSASAITTVVLSKQDVEYVKMNHNVDFEDPRVARSIMNKMNFICMVIADEVSETCKFLWDTGEDRYETTTFDALEREDKNSKLNKQLMSYLSSIRR